MVGLPNCESFTALAPDCSLKEAVIALGGVPSLAPPPLWPIAMIGSVVDVPAAGVVWRVTWEGWRGGVFPTSLNGRLSEHNAIPLAPALAAAICASEAFSYHAGDHVLAGHRAAGLFLWKPSTDWTMIDDTERELRLLPSRLWVSRLFRSRICSSTFDLPTLTLRRTPARCIHDMGERRGSPS